MKSKYLLLPALILIIAGCTETKQIDYSKPLNQLADSVNKLNSNIDDLSKRVESLEQKNNAQQPIDATNGNEYTNTKLGFSITLPTGWLLPAADDNDPHFYSGKDCMGNDLRLPATCLAFEIQSEDYLFTKGFDSAFNTLSSGESDLKPVNVQTLIPNGSTIKSSPEPGTEGWYYAYHFYSPTTKKGFLFLTNTEKLEANILATFKLN